MGLRPAGGAKGGQSLQPGRTGSTADPRVPPGTGCPDAERHKEVAGTGTCLLFSEQRERSKSCAAEKGWELLGTGLFLPWRGALYQIKLETETQMR